MAIYDLNRAQLKSLVTQAVGLTTSGTGQELWNLLAAAGDLPPNTPAGNKLQLPVAVGISSDQVDLTRDDAFFVQTGGKLDTLSSGIAIETTPGANTVTTSVYSRGDGWLFASNLANVSLTDENNYGSNTGNLGDTIWAGTGDDSIALVSTARNLIHGGQGRDTLVGGSGRDTIISGSHATKAGTNIYGGGHTDMFAGGADDSLYGYSPNNNVYAAAAPGPGGVSNAISPPTSVADTLNAGGGHDLLTVYTGDNLIVGSTVATAQATIYAGSGNDSISLHAGAYTINVGAKTDIYGRAQSAKVWLQGSGGGAATLTGGSGAESLTLGSGANYDITGAGGRLTVTDSMSSITGRSATVNLGSGGGSIFVDTTVTGAETKVTTTGTGAHKEYTYTFASGVTLTTNASTTQIKFDTGGTAVGHHPNLPIS